MIWFEAIILGLIQGLTEFLPVSSSGHLEIAKSLFGVDPNSGFYFPVAVLGIAVLGTLFVFWNDKVDIFSGSLNFKMNRL